jgi:opacity protein-like surface antigen
MNAVRGKGNPQATHPEVRSIGERPEDEADIRKLFLRQSSVLLPPGRAELEVGAQYQRSRNDSTVLNSLSRQALLTLGGRVGLAERWQGFFNLPLSYASQQFSFGQEESVTRRSGLGDVNAGVNYQLLREGSALPDVVALAGLSAPTGRSPYADGGSGVALGAGHWSANLGVQLIKTTDPVAIYGGIGLTQHFARNGLGRRIKPGNAFGYNLGLSFAINDTVSVSGEFVGSAQATTREDDVRMIGTSREPMQFRSGMIYRVAKDWYLAPTISYGLNRDAPDVTLGVSSSHRLK